MCEKDAGGRDVELSDNLSKLSKEVAELYDKFTEYMDREHEAMAQIMFTRPYFGELKNSTKNVEAKEEDDKNNEKEDNCDAAEKEKRDKIWEVAIASPWGEVFLKLYDDTDENIKMMRKVEDAVTDVLGWRNMLVIGAGYVKP